MTQMVIHAIKRYFQLTNTIRIYTNAHADNIGSTRVLEKQVFVNAAYTVMPVSRMGNLKIGIIMNC